MNKTISMEEYNKKYRVDYNIISAIRKFGVKKVLRSVPHFKNYANFFEEVSREMPEVIAYMPENLYSYSETLHKTAEYRDEKFSDALIHIYKKNPETYKYMKPEHALIIRQFEKSTHGYIVSYAGKIKSYGPKYYFPSVENGVTSNKQKEFLEELDKMRPDVKKLAEEGTSKK